MVTRSHAYASRSAGFAGARWLRTYG
jgi:hypothetical protein